MKCPLVLGKEAHNQWSGVTAKRVRAAGVQRYASLFSLLVLYHAIFFKMNLLIELFLIFLPEEKFGNFDISGHLVHIFI